MGMDEKRSVNELIRASIFDIAKTEEISKFIEDGVFTSEYDICMVYEDVISFLPHLCNDACLVHNSDGTFRCQKLDNVRVSNYKKTSIYSPTKWLFGHMSQNTSTNWFDQEASYWWWLKCFRI